jgi:RNA polymerase sigma factor (sigma-70 family)
MDSQGRREEVMVADTTFEEFLTHALPQLLDFAHRLTADPLEAEELVQAALARTMMRWPAIERGDDPLEYARRVMIRTHVSPWRRRAARVSAGSVPAHTSPSRPGLSGDQESVRAALRSLPPRQRAAVVLRLSESMSDAQVAAALSCRPATAKTLATRGLAAINRGDQLRQTLLGADWSLQLWPAPKQQLRRAARRRRLVGAGTFVVVVAVAVGVAIPLSTSAASHQPHPTGIDPPDLSRTRQPLPGLDDPRFPVSVYPAAVGPVKDGFPQCPSIEGVGPRPTLDPAAYAGIVSDFGHPSLQNDLRRTDRSLWPLVLAADQNPPLRRVPQQMPVASDPGKGITVVPAAKDGLTRGAASACGAELVARSVAVQVGPNTLTMTAADDILVLQRHGHLLIWGRDPTLYANGSFLAYRNVQRLIDTKSDVAPCRLDGSSNAVVSIAGNTAHVSIFELPQSPFSCSLIGWPAIRLATPDYAQQVTPTDVGLDTPVLLRPHQSASFTITARSCGGAHTTYTNGQFAAGDLALEMSVGECGATVSSYTLDK